MAPNDALRRWLDDQNIKPAEFARSIEYDRSNFHNLLAGKIGVSLTLAHRIELATGGAVPMSAWAEAKAA